MTELTKNPRVSFNEDSLKALESLQDMGGESFRDCVNRITDIMIELACDSSDQTIPKRVLSVLSDIRCYTDIIERLCPNK